MEDKSLNPQKFFKTACYFEGSLILVALFLGWIADINPFADLHFSENAILYGLLGTLPLFVLFVAMQQLQIESVQRVRKLLLETLGPAMHGYGWADLFVLAAIAGLSEEVLFRGVLQPWMEAGWGMNAGLLFSNIIFGLVHAVTPLYAALATLVGIYLGVFLDYGGERNLLTPVIIHTLYDFLAFLVIMRAYKAGKEEK
ncbi:CPBP family intramembrane glutamic endopeptidase [Methylomarinum sp. Ch1-1]|uniref:CPBP family intramembrane glutamic endopeptidase n=1 Tax=Methylomarinum roseum TaxID=3067653 RepID=A0AAU7NVM8_9GAMM|nr:CPBP family intramembrane glutamic endopeptidase [Methylomarinum sp. Ch1-1]MDP4522922.1 CPBP family intramembrane metalloprotease [Methylomarinum sp. Ch1-1]